MAPTLETKTAPVGGTVTGLLGTDVASAWGGQGRLPAAGSPVTSYHITALSVTSHQVFVFCLPPECRLCDKGVLVHFVRCVSRTVPETQ